MSVICRNFAVSKGNKGDKDMEKKHSYKVTLNEYSTNKEDYKKYENAIQMAISRFKKSYSMYDKCIATTKKAVTVSIRGKIMNISIDLYSKHYSQCYEIVNYDEIQGMRINW